MADHVVSVLITGDASQLTAALQNASQQIQNFSANSANVGSQAAGGMNQLATAAATGRTSVQQLAQAAQTTSVNINRSNVALRMFGQFAALAAQQTTLMGKAMVYLKGYLIQTEAIFMRWMGPYQIIRMVESGVRFLVDSFISFDDKFVQSTAIMENLSEVMKNSLVKGVQDVAASTKFSASEAAEGLYFIASAGFDAKSSLEILPIAARFAQAGVIDMAKATEYLADATSAMGLVIRDAYGINVEETAKNMEHMSDVMVKTAVLSNATVDQVAQSMTGRAAGMMRVLQKTPEEFASIIAAFASVGIKGQTASTQIYMAMRDLQKAALNNGAAFTQLGIQVYDSAGKMMPFSSIMNQLHNSMKGLSDEEKKLALQQLGFQDRSSTAIMAVMDLGNQMKVTEAKLREAGGTTKEVAEKQMQSFANQITHVKNVIGNFAVDAGYAFMELFGKIKDGLEPFAAEFSTAFNSITKYASLFIDAMKPIVGIFAGSAFKAGTFALTTILNVLNRIGIAMPLITGYMVTWAARSVLSSGLVQKSMEAAQGSIAGLASSFQNGGAVVGGFGQRIVGGMGSIWSKVSVVAPGVTSRINDMASNIWSKSQMAGNGFKALAGMIGDAAPAIIASITMILSSQEAVSQGAKKMADSFMGGTQMNSDSFDEQIKKTNAYVAETNRLTEEYDKAFGTNYWTGTERAMRTFQQMGEFINPFNDKDVYRDMEAQTKAFQENASKQTLAVQNVNEAYKKFGQGAGISQEEIYKTAKELQIPLDQIINWDSDQGKVRWAEISSAVASTRTQVQIFGSTSEEAAAKADNGIVQYEESVKKTRDGLISAMSDIADPFKKYNEAISKSIDLTDVFQSVLQRNKSDKEEAYQLAQQAQDNAMQSQLDSLEAQKQVELDRISQNQREVSQAQRAASQQQRNDISDAATDQKDAITDGSKTKTDAQKAASRDAKQAVSQDARDQKQAISSNTQDVIDTYSDSSERERQTIESKYKAREETIRRGAASNKAASDAAKKQAEKDGSYVSVSANQFNSALEATAASAKEYRSLISQAIDKGADIDLVKMFESMKPEEAIPVLHSFIDNYQTEMGRFNKVNEDLKQQRLPGWNEVKQMLTDSTKNMKDLQKNINTLAAAGVDPGSIFPIIEKMKDKAPDVIKQLVDQLGKEGGAGEVQQVLNDFAKFNDVNIQKSVDAMASSSKLLYANYLIAHGKVQEGKDELNAALSQMTPEKIQEQLHELGFDEQLNYTMTDQVRSVWDTLEVNLKLKAQGLLDYFRQEREKMLEENGQLTQYYQDIFNQRKQSDQASLDKLNEERIKNGQAPITGVAGANGMITQYASGGENHIAQISKGMWRLWAEPETGGEAYIPLSPNKRDRSEAILSDVANRFGYALVKQDQNRAEALGMSTRWMRGNQGGYNSTSGSVHNKVVNNFNGVPVERAMIMSERRTASQLSGRTVQ